MDLLPTEVAGWYIRQLNIPVASWIAVLSMAELLTAGIITRADRGLNILLGYLGNTTDYDRAGHLRQLGEKLSGAIRDNNTIPPINFKQIPLTIRISPNKC